ncbi:hypothetical protein K443DRAFT_104775 [Laccaria amethystina LaAM-08-1]|uniref:Uncharacterized protein n=1 Tax=Laccaria amethystina LaAM-08-1 TaxID=1095629 RepID=A0A0C9XPS4_9AGAR|nr:hypothetical protein K443DRAFT_104775 [Laccaria amethystina LaAM-08-1]
MDQLQQEHSAPAPDQTSSDGRGGSNTKGTTKVPRYLYYRLYTKDGPITSNNPIHANDQFLSRTLTKFITPPRTALSVKGHICSIENLPRNTECSLFESLSGLTAIENTARLSIRGPSGPGLSEYEPVILVTGSQDVERSPPKLEPGMLPDAALHEPRYLYYRVYKETEGAIASKTHFDLDDNTLGRIDMLSVAPPHIVASLKSRIIKAEGNIVNQNMQIFKNIDGEEMMNDKDHLSFQADTYPGCEEDDPIAIVCGEAPVNQAKSQESEKKTTTFSKSIRVTGTWLADPPNWLPVSTIGDVLKTDGVKTSEIHRNNGAVLFPEVNVRKYADVVSYQAMRYDGYIAMNSAGIVGCE